MQRGGDHDDARRRTGLQAIEQQLGEQERTHVVRCERQLVAILRQAAIGEHDPGVVDQHVQASPPVKHACCGLTDRCQRRQVDVHLMHVPASRGRADVIARLADPNGTSAGHQHRCARLRQSQRCGKADSGVRSGDQSNSSFICCSSHARPLPSDRSLRTVLRWRCSAGSRLNRRRWLDSRLL